ncbi:hypothetical protein C5S29_07435 [ANME-1 cluster archaeon GoMg3.2]|nr:hypothetical protein [ANME-1 cluster archaeon GoMg3.2]
MNTVQKIVKNTEIERKDKVVIKDKEDILT